MGHYLLQILLHSGNPYGVTGVLSNSGVQVAQVDNVPDPNSYSDYLQHTMTSEINIIGYDWKSFDMSTFSYSVEPYRCYFIKDQNDKIWRIVFTSLKEVQQEILNLIWMK